MRREYNNEGCGGQGRGARTGRGHGRTSPEGRGQATTKYKEAEMKFYPYSNVPGKVSATYQTVKDAIIQQIQRNYEYGQDMATCLQDMKMMDLKPKCLN